jgi:hypothetical protein
MLRDLRSYLADALIILMVRPLSAEFLGDARNCNWHMVLRT